MLGRILEEKRTEVARLRAGTGLAELRRLAADAPPARPFLAGLGAATAKRSECIAGQGRLAVIAEIKRASPSRGRLAGELNPAALAARYARGGASAISVLTDREFFAGSLSDLRAVRKAVACPVLRKDFVIDPVQVYESRAAGADALLLIVAALSDAKLAELLALAHELGMACLVETHDEQELARAVASGARFIGINNRDLRTFAVDLGTTERLAQLVPADRVLVAESGVRSPADAPRLAAAGADAILVGELLVTAADPEAALRDLRAVARGQPRPAGEWRREG